MAKRYSGDLQINVAWDDRGFYRTSVSQDGKSLWSGTVGPVESGLAKDSSQTYDEVASTALSFADDEVKGIGDDAEAKEDLSGWLIRRKPRTKKAARALGPASQTGQSPRSHATRPQIAVNKITGRWQPVNASGTIIRGNAYNADGRGYSTRQGAEEAASMIRRLGKRA